MSVTAAKADALGARYGSLLKALAPELDGLVLAGPDLRRQAHWGESPSSIDPLLLATGWASAVPARGALLGQDLGESRYLVILPLVADSGRLIGAVGLVSKLSDRTAIAGLGARLAPGIECLRQEISTSDATARAAELQLMRTATQMQLDYDDGTTVEQLLDDSLRRGGSEAVMLYVPARGILITRQISPQLSPSVAAEWSGLRPRLRQLAKELRKPLIISGPAVRADRGAGCRMLIVPMRLCHGQATALLAYLNPTDSPPYNGQQVLILQSLAATILRCFEEDLDRTTGLLNRAGLEEVLRRLKSGMGSLILMDIDRLHAINEVHGFAAGDRLIVQVGGLLRRPLLPQGSYAARLFGGCFAVLLPQLEAQAAADVAIKIQNEAGALKIENSAESVAVTLSCGVAEIKSFTDPLSKAFVAAELVLKLAKERGRSRVEVHVSENSSIIRRHDEVFAAADLREALRTNQVVMYAQKIVSLRDGDAPVGFELLVRMRDTNSGEIRAPGEFIAAAQRYQLLPAVDRYVVDSALSTLAPYRTLLARQRISMSINVSAQSVGDPEFVAHFIRKLRESRIPPSFITVEITEQAALMNLAQASDMMRRLREVGCGIALDDFGTGANSLAYLRTLPATRIKIDGSFIKDILTNPRSDAAVRGIAQLAKGFRLDTVAEFVETAAVAEKLRQMGIDHGQGYLYGKPEPLEVQMQALQARESADLSEILQLN